MKLLRYILIAACACGLSFGQSKKKMPYEPIGQMSATPSVVQTGTYPTLTWNIAYPSKVSDVAVISPNGEIQVTKKTFVSVIPVGFKSNKYTECTVSVNGGNYERFFFSTNDGVLPQYSSYIKEHSKFDKINFGSRTVNEFNEWNSPHTTKNGSSFIALVDGDKVPRKVADYTKPYVDSTSRVRIGPMSVLVMAQLSESGLPDYQDAVFIVNFSSKHSNNGHGNNIDGVDVSNPSNGNGGPNGAFDPSGEVDDEK